MNCIKTPSCKQMIIFIAIDASAAGSTSAVGF